MREIPKEEPEGFPEGSGYISPYIPTQPNPNPDKVYHWLKTEKEEVKDTFRLFYN